MARINVCDLCGKEMLECFTDEQYKIKVIKISNAYDGIAPFKRKRRVDVCDDCMRKIIRKAKI